MDHRCPSCSLAYAQPLHHPTLGTICPWCDKPLGASLHKSVPRWTVEDQRRIRSPEYLAEQEELTKWCSARIWKRRERTAVRAAERELAPEQSDVLLAWLESAPGSPLGVGMPSGRALREDGESHHEWWCRTLRDDHCTYCGRPSAGTVDHVIPKASGRRFVHRWANLVGSCQSCNGAKAAKPLLDFLLVRARQHDRRARRSVQREQDRERNMRGGVERGEGDGAAVAHATRIGRSRAA